MKVITFITTLCLCIVMVQSSLAQPDVMPEIEEVLKNGRKSMTLPDFLNLLGLDGEEYKIKHQITGVEDFKFRKKFPYNKVNFKTHWFNFSFMTDARDKILFSSVELLGVKTEEKRDFVQIHTDFNNFIEAHETFYKIDIDMESQLMLPFIDYTLEIDESNDLCKKLLNIVATKNATRLEQWLKSMNPTIQTYGVIGFELIKKMDTDFKLSKEQKRIINHIKSLENTIPFNSNFDVNTEISIKDALADSYIETYWYLIKDATIFQD